MRTLVFAAALLCASVAQGQFWWSTGSPINPYPATWEGITTPYYVPYYYEAYYPADDYGGDYYVGPRRSYYRQHIPYTVGPHRSRRWR